SRRSAAPPLPSSPASRSGRDRGVSLPDPPARPGAGRRMPTARQPPPDPARRRGARVLPDMPRPVRRRAVRVLSYMLGRHWRSAGSQRFPQDDIPKFENEIDPPDQTLPQKIRPPTHGYRTYERFSSEGSEMRIPREPYFGGADRR